MSLLDFLTVFDWITPVVAEIKDISVGKGNHASFIMDEGGVSGAKVAKELKKKGVESWGWIGRPGANGMMFTVRKEHAGTALKVLNKLGVGIQVCPDVSESRASRSSENPATHSEWTCEYCGRRNPGWVYQCQGCGHQ